MDDVESIELDKEGLDFADPEMEAIVEVYARFKSGHERTIKFNVPTETPIYGEPITATSIYEIISTAYSFGEVPFLSIPDGDGDTFIDLSATDYIKVRVLSDE